MVIGIDFDGTCVAHEFPNIGKEIGAVPVLKRLIGNGHQLVLFTMRSDVENPSSTSSEIIPKKGNYLSEAVNWFALNGIELYGIQTNPTQASWTSSPKAYCQLYIDDAGLGIPLTFDLELSKRPFVDWNAAEKLLETIEVLK